MNKFYKSNWNITILIYSSFSQPTTVDILDVRLGKHTKCVVVVALQPCVRICILLYNSKKKQYEYYVWIHSIGKQYTDDLFITSAMILMCASSGHFTIPWCLEKVVNGSKMMQVTPWVTWQWQHNGYSMSGHSFNIEHMCSSSSAVSDAAQD